jgi:hypothetical protein
MPSSCGGLDNIFIAQKKIPKKFKKFLVKFFFREIGCPSLVVWVAFLKQPALPAF